MRVISLSKHLLESIFSREDDITSTQNLLISFKPIICKLNYSHVIIWFTNVNPVQDNEIWIWIFFRIFDFFFFSSHHRRPPVYTRAILDFNFSAAPVGSEPCIVNLMFENTGTVATEWLVFITLVMWLSCDKDHSYIFIRFSFYYLGHVTSMWQRSYKFIWFNDKYLCLLNINYLSY